MGGLWGGGHSPSGGDYKCAAASKTCLFPDDADDAAAGDVLLYFYCSHSPLMSPRGDCERLGLGAPAWDGGGVAVDIGNDANADLRFACRPESARTLSDVWKP